MSLEKYLHPASGEPPHPVLRRWEALRKRPGVAKITCRFWRERDGLTFRPAELYVGFVDVAGEDMAPPDAQLWDQRLDDWLIEREARAESAGNEAERFGYALHHRFADAVERFGDGYFNSVLAELLHEGGLATLPAVGGALKGVREYAPARGQARDDCRLMIDAAIASVGGDLTGRLHYPNDKALEILAGALAYYLDERFGVTNRRLLGFG